MRAFFGLILTAAAAGAGEPLVLDLWPGKAPGEADGAPPEVLQQPKAGEASPTLRVTNVSKPTLTVYRPAKGKDTGTAVVIAPGGGYNILAWDKEGTEVAEWLNSIGVTGIVLKYRVPRRPSDGKGPPQGALQDGQRAVRLVRSKAQEWGLDARRIGMLGFSAGGHLTAWTATNFDKAAYEAVDGADKVSARPDFAILIYPGYLDAKDGLAADIRVSKETPPTFLVHANDDPVKPENSLAMYAALRKAGVPAEMHIYASGGHGYGLRKSEHMVSTWPARCGEWMKARGVLGQ